MPLVGAPQDSHAGSLWCSSGAGQVRIPGCSDGTYAAIVLAGQMHAALGDAETVLSMHLGCPRDQT